MNCINKKSKQFIDLLEKTGLHHNILEAKIINYQNKNGIDSWPKDSYFNNGSGIDYQKNQSTSEEGQIASEKTIRDLAARMSDRIGISVEFISDRTKEYKGKLEGNIAYINLAYATLDTPIHEILGHPIIRTIKNNYKSVKYEPNKSDPFGFTLKEKDGYTQLYQNLLKELETGKGKEVLDRIKRDYQFKNFNNIAYVSENVYIVPDAGDTSKGRYYLTNENSDNLGNYTLEEISKKYPNLKESKYTLDEQQEEALVELLGLMTAEKLDAVKDGKLISLLKRLLKEMKSFMRSLLRQREVDIDKLPDIMTLGDLSDLLAYSNSKLILPGKQVVYTTPDNQKFKTFAEASKHIGSLATSIENIDLDNVKINLEDLQPPKREDFNVPKGVNYKGKEVVDILYEEGQSASFGFDDNQFDPGSPDIFTLVFDDGTTENFYSDRDLSDKIPYIYKYGNYPFNRAYQIYNQIKKESIVDFISKNREFEQSKEIVEEWKKINNIQYNPEEIYSRGQEFVSVVGAYSDFDVNLMMQNLLVHIEDNQKAGGKFAISAYTKPVDRKIGHLEGTGDKIKFKIYPQSNDILWAANSDVFSGSVWDASKKISKDKSSELLGVSYTKYPSLGNIHAVQPNLAYIVDNLVHHHNELGIVLTGNNFRLEYDKDIPYSTKKIIDGINSILDQKYGKIIKPEINRDKISSEIFDEISRLELLKKEDWAAPDHIDLFTKKDKERLDYLKSLTKSGIQPTQTKESLIKSIDNIKSRNTSLEENRWAVEPYAEGEYAVFTYMGEFVEGQPNFKSLEEAQKWLKDNKPKEKDYTEQALINTKIAKLKEVAKKYPRSLIRSEVKPVNKSDYSELFDEDELPFQKINKTQLDLFNDFIPDRNRNPITVQERMDIIKELTTVDENKKIFKKYDPFFGSFEVPDNTQLEAKATKIIAEINHRFTSVGRPAPMKYNWVPIKKFTSRNRGRQKFMSVKIMGVNGIFNQVDSAKELGIPNPALDTAMKGIMNDLGISLSNWEDYKSWYEKKFNKPLNAAGVADMVNRTIAIQESYAKIDTLPEEVGHFILYAMKDIPWVKNLLARVEETPEWNEYSKSYIKEYKGDMQAVRLEVLGKILAKGLMNEGQALTPKWRRLIGELWQRFLALFGRDDIRKRMDYLAAEVLTSSTLRKTLAVNLDRYGITAEDTGIFYSLNVDSFKESDVLNKYSTIVQKAVENLADALRRDMNSKSTAVKGRMDLYEKSVKLINDGNHTLAMASMIDGMEKESISVLGRIKEFNDLFKEESPKADFFNFSRVLLSAKNFVSTYTDTITRLRSELNDDRRELLVEMENLGAVDNLSELEVKNLEQMKKNLNLINELIKSINNVTEVSEKMNMDYLDYAKEIFVHTTKDILEERFDKYDLSEEQREKIMSDLRGQLDEAGDINALNKWVQSMAESGDNVLGIADRLVKNKLEEAKIESIDAQKRLLDIAEEYFKVANSRDTSFMYALNEEGKLNGKYVNEIDRGKYLDNKKLFFLEINSRYDSLLKNAKNDTERGVIQDKKSKEISSWYKTNEEPLSKEEVEDIKKRKKDSIFAYYVTNPENKRQVATATKAYEEWLNKNQTVVNETGKVYYKREFVRPNRKVYASKQYAKLTDTQKKFHTEYMKLLKEMKKDMPDGIYNSDDAIQMRKDGVERLLSSESKFKEFQNMMSEAFLRQSDDIEYGMVTEDLSTEEILRQRALLDSTGRKIWTIPIRYVMSIGIKDKNNPDGPLDYSELSTDAVSSLSAFIGSSKRYEKISEIADALEVFGDMLQERKMVKKDLRGNTSVTGSGGEAYWRYMKNLEMVVYGREKQDEGTIFNTNIDQAKLIDAISSYTAMNNLALNMYAGIANVGLGNILLREEAFAKQYVTHEDINFGISEYGKQLPGYINEIGSFRSNNKMKLLLEYTDALQDHENRMSDLNWGKDKYMRMMNRSHLYFMNHMGEHQLQSRMMLALMHNTKLKDTDGKDITMYDAFEVGDNRVTIKEGITYPNGKKFTQKDVSSFNIKMRAINQRLHGIYNREDKNAIQQYSLGRAAMMFRKWVVPGINRRFEREYFNWSDMEMREGMYRTSAKFLLGVIKELRETKDILSSAKNNWSKLTDAQKANMARSISEAAYFITMMVAGSAMAMFAKGLDDDDELMKFLANHTAHATLRIKSEIGFYSNPNDFLKLMQSPAASVNTIQKLLDVVKTIDFRSMIDEEREFFRVYKSGRYKDDLYISVWAKGTIPMWRTVSDYAHAEDKLKFFTE